MVLFAHHAEAVFKVEIMGREFPNGMTEHVIGFSLAAAVVALAVYGAFAAFRDWRRARARRPAAGTAG
jgi:hydrogenase/urease accessory protein HupE